MQKMLKKLSEKLRAKFPATTCGYSMVKFAVLMKKGKRKGEKKIKF